MNVSEIFKTLRLDSGLTQKELAGKLNISQAAVSAYEKGEREPIARVIISYAEFFGVTTDYILGLEELSGINGGKGIIMKSEQEILQFFSMLDDEGKAVALTQIGALVELQRNVGRKK